MLNDPYQSGFDKVDLVGLAIRRTVARQFHVGLLYKTGQRTNFRHQCDHHDLKDDEAGNFEYLWADIVALDKVNKRLLANKMSKAGGDKVPYGVGFQSGREYIDKKTLKYVSTEIGQGLSCATYIAAVMEGMGFKPLDMNGWVATDEDTKWQTGMIADRAKKFPEDADHFEAENANIGGPRVRPDHVMATAFKKPWPINQADANEIGRSVIDDYDGKRPPVLPATVLPIR